MKRFIEFISERFINLGPNDHEKKHAIAKEVYGMLQKSYEKLGGIHGSGFKDHHDMVKNIPLWKVHKKDGKIRAVQLYKDKIGRKGVAVATDGSEEGKKSLATIVKDDITRRRSYKEVSGPALSFGKKHIPDLHKHVMKHEDVKKHLTGEEIRKPPHDDPEVVRHPELKDHFYQRKIGDHWHTKIMIGTAGKKIT
jgi:hypothetical protein